MKKDTLNMHLSKNDGYGKYESLIASQANGAGTKKLILVTEIRGETHISNHFRILHNNIIVDASANLETAKEVYNNIK